MTSEATSLLRLPRVIDRVGLKKTVIYGKIKSGTFPAPIKLGTASVWDARKVDEWIAQQLQQQAA